MARKALLVGGILLGSVTLAGSDARAAAAAAPAMDGPDDLVLARVLARPDEPHARLRGVRRMRAHGLGKEAFMVVRVALDPVKGFRYDVLAEGGSKFLRERAFLGMLQEEQ